jgi:hypothetical protein
VSCGSDSIFKQPNAVIASVSEAIHGAASGKMDCFVARAPRNDGKTYFAISPRAFCARYSIISRPLRIEGAGNAGRPMRPIAACALVEIESTRVSQVTPESPGIPHAMVLTAYTVLSPVLRAFWPPSPALRSANLTPASGCQDHTSLPSAIRAVRYRRIRVHRIPPRGRDDRDSPLCGTGRLRI